MRQPAQITNPSPQKGANQLDMAGPAELIHDLNPVQREARVQQMTRIAGKSDRVARDRPVEQVQLRRVRPGCLGPHPVAGGARRQGLRRGPSSERQL